jgi:hypothetical protein
MLRSSSGPGCHPFTVITAVRICSGVLVIVLCITILLLPLTLMRKQDEEGKQRKRDYEREWYRTKGRQKRIDANKRWEEKKVAEFKQIKSTLKCNRCPENHPACLEFHHTDPTIKEGNVGESIRKWSTKRLLAEIEKCEVLCANCHRKEHYKISPQSL